MNKIMNDQAEIVAFLHCELPTGGKVVSSSEKAGTLELGDVSGDGPSARETIPLLSGHAFRIGRARANDLVIENGGVSRFHAIISASEAGVVLSDLSSLNGTQVNGRRITAPVDVGSGDILQIGSVKITIELGRRVTSPNKDEDDTILSTTAHQMASVMVTVLVADVCSYTKMSQQLPPHDVADMLNRWFKKVGDAIHAHGGEIDKYIGDCVMALWRSPNESIERSAVSAIQAAERILRDTEQLAKDEAWKYQDVHPWGCRVALNTGEALMGAVGTGGARDFTVLGDTVNIAFRLESLASSQGSSLAISEGTAKLVAQLLPLRSLGEVILEGRKNTLEVFTLERD